MQEIIFQALGTSWSVFVDGKRLRQEDSEKLKEQVLLFEKKFSRFLPESEVNQFRQAKKGAYQVSEELAVMLKRALTLRAITKGVYDPAVATLLEEAGYDKEYRFTPNENLHIYTAPNWDIQDTTLMLEGPLAFDLGGIGKGYCIDLVAKFLHGRGYRHFLVEAGGDMYGTEKEDGSSFRVALEWPGRPDTAFGVVELKNQGLAASDSFRRRWQNWHHIVNPLTKEPITEVIGCAALSQNAFDADCLTSVLFLLTEEEYSAIQQKFEGEFVVFTQEGKVVISEGWPGELFS